MGGIEEVQKHENLSPRAENSLTLSYKNSKRMLSLINQILDFRKVVKNKMELCVERLDIVEVAKGVMDDFRDLADERKINLMFSFSHESINIWGDRQRLESLIYNLVSNALAYTERGSVDISLTPDGDHVVLKVSDTGIGISYADQERVFERFYRVDMARSRESGGTGLGLSLVRHAVERAHGTVELASEPGEGSTFTVRFWLVGARTRCSTRTC
jgi:signal transduction histidine kinase